MKSSKLFSIAGLMLSGWLTGPAMADDQPRLEDLGLTGVAIQGSGCPLDPQHSLSLTAADELTLEAGSWSVDLMNGLPGQRKFCQATFNIERPSGWTYAISNIAVVGSLRLHGGSSAYIKATSYAQGDEETSSSTLYWRNYRVKDLEEDMKLEPLAFVPCDAERALNVKIEARVDGVDGGEAKLVVGAPAKMKITWKRCGA